MALKKVRTGGGKTEWWENAYPLNDNIVVQYELQFGKDLIKPGTKVRIKNDRRIYLFRCIAHNIELDEQWIDVIGPDGDWRSFHPAKLKGIVKPKKSRAKKIPKTESEK